MPPNPETRIPNPALCPLHVRSGYSLLRGASALGRVVAQAAEMGHRRIALTDVNNLCGATLFWKHATAAGLTPIIGAELVEDGRSVVALVESERGYEDLCQTITRVRKREECGLRIADCGLREKARFSSSNPNSAFRNPQLLADLAALSDGLQLVVEQASLAEHLLASGVDAGRIWLGIDPATQTHAQLRALAETAAARGLPAVATGKVMMARAEDFETARLLAAIRTGGTMDNVPTSELPHPRAVMRTAHELREQLLRAQDLAAAASRNNERLAERCADFKLLPRAPVFPDYRCPEGLDALSHLRQLCEEGLWRRYGGDLPAAAPQRLARELELIARMGFCEYFLVVWDIVQYARRRGAPVAGRGSGGSSLVAYLLGITNVCPIAFEIPFERFLNEYRADFPDLDVDFCWRIRDEVIAYAFNRWGSDHVAMVSMHTTFQDRSALRETAKALGMSNEQISAERDSGFDIRDSGAEVPAVPESRNPNPETPVSSLARRLLGLPHVLSVHPGGIVIGRKAIDHYVPIQAAAKGVMISQLDKNGLEDMKLVKLDLLGNRNLSTIRAAADLVRRRAGVSIDIESLPTDAATIEMLQRADTVGCNQLESPAMRHLLRMMQPQGVRDVMKALALIRPGAASIGMKEVFIRRHRGLESGMGVPPMSSTGILPVSHTGVPPVSDIERQRNDKSEDTGETSVEHMGKMPMSRAARTGAAQKTVAALLRDTCGVMMYEDDVMLVAAAMMDSSLDQADRFRKAVQKCPDDAARLELSRQFLAACAARGCEPEFAKSMWVQMAKFNAYSFCRAHAASYAVLAYAGAYLKAHWPVEFWCAALNNNQSMYPTRCYVEQAKRQGVVFLDPDVNRSEEEFSIEERDSGFGIRVSGEETSESGIPNPETRFPKPASCIRVGLNRVSGLGPAHIQTLLRARAHGPFAGLSDCLARTDLSREQARSLILCGAFDFTARPRPALMLELELFLSTQMGRIWQGQSLLAIGANMPVVPGDYDPLQKYMQERQVLGLCTGRHIMEIYRKAGFGIRDSGVGYRRSGAESRNPIPESRSCDIPARVGRRISIAGVMEAQRSALTLQGRTMLFLTLDDEHGLFEVTIFPDQCRLCPLDSYGPYVVTGTVEDQYGALTIRAQSVERLVNGE